ATSTCGPASRRPSTTPSACRSSTPSATASGSTKTRSLRRRRDELRLLVEEGMKSTVEEIRRRFDADVERFSNLETGQSARVDAPLAMALVAEAAAATTPHARHVLDVGCGAGNYT